MSPFLTHFWAQKPLFPTFYGSNLGLEGGFGASSGVLPALPLDHRLGAMGGVWRVIPKPSRPNPKYILIVISNCKGKLKPPRANDWSGLNMIKQRIINN